MTATEHRAIAGELADAWGDLLRAEDATPAIAKAAQHRMAEAVAQAVGALDPGHFHDPDPERLGPAFADWPPR